MSDNDATFLSGVYLSPPTISSLKPASLSAVGGAPLAFELLARKTVGVQLGPMASLQLPFSFATRDMSEKHARLAMHGEYRGRALHWFFPIVGVSVSRPLQKPIALACPARQPLQRQLELPLPGLDESAVEEGFTYELDVSPEHALVLAKTLTLSPMQRTLAGSTLVMAVDWRPLRPIRSSAALVVQKNSGGRWRYDITLEAGEPEPDDVIYIESAINKMSAVSFRLANVFNADAPFTAYFTPDSPAVFSVSPVAGILSRAGTAGQVFTVSYAPIEYGKPVRGTLIVLTDEMQWSYEVCGMHPQYAAPPPSQGM